MRILLIDDAESFRDAVRLVLERAGHSISVASSGRDGLAKVLAIHFDLVITDIFMPDVDGVEFLRGLADQPCPPPVLAMSGGWGVHANPDLGGDWMRALGADGYLPKPFEDFELIEEIDRVIAEARLTNQLVGPTLARGIADDSFAP